LYPNYLICISATILSSARRRYGPIKVLKRTFDPEIRLVLKAVGRRSIRVNVGNAEQLAGMQIDPQILRYCGVAARTAPIQTLQRALLQPKIDTVTQLFVYTNNVAKVVFQTLLP